MSTKTVSFSLLCAVLLALSAPASAEIPARALHIGASGGVHWVADDWDLHERADWRPGAETGGALYLRLGAEWNRWLVTEVGVGVLPYPVEGESNAALDYHADVLLQLNRAGLVPYLGLGAGAYHNVYGQRGPDLDYELHYALGVRLMATDWLALRAEARHLLTDGSVDPGIANNLLFTAGLDIFVWEAGPEEPEDSDGDGVADVEDACPAQAGSPSAAGCPDRDGDGVRDASDTCPDTPGLSNLQGCPDADADGIADRVDKCPDKPGTPELEGCPAPVETVPEVVPQTFEGRFEGILFPTGSAEILSSSHAVLDRVAETLTKYETVKVSIEGHTDSRGDDEDNRELSLRRAESVRAYLVSKGITASRLEVEGFGEDKPVASNKTKQGRARNRRIELRITSR